VPPTWIAQIDVGGRSPCVSAMRRACRIEATSRWCATGNRVLGLGDGESTTSKLALVGSPCGRDFSSHATVGASGLLCCVRDSTHGSRAITLHSERGEVQISLGHAPTTHTLNDGLPARSYADEYLSFRQRLPSSPARRAGNLVWPSPGAWHNAGAKVVVNGRTEGAASKAVPK